MNNQLQPFLHLTVLENQLQDFLLLAGWLLFGFIFKKFISKNINRFVYQLIRKYSSGISIEKFYELLNKPLGFLILLIIIYLGFDNLEFPSSWNLVRIEKFGIRMLVDRGYDLLIATAIMWILFRLVDFIGLIFAQKTAISETNQEGQWIVFATEILKITISVFGIIFILGSIFHINVTSLIAGLGIGGLAVALAAKESLENILCSFIIFFDKPFIVGDLVKVGNVEGKVEKVGFRSTRIRTVEKSYLTIPNRKMIDAELDNLSLKTFRRVRFNIGLTFNTKASQLKAIVASIQHILDENPEIAMEGQTRFTKIGAFSLEIRIEYFVTTIDWDTFLRVQEEVNFQILEIIERHGGTIAYPSQTVHLEGK